MKLHVMPGDSLTDNFKQTGIEGEIAVCRECLIAGKTSPSRILIWPRTVVSVELFDIVPLPYPTSPPEIY